MYGLVPVGEPATVHKQLSVGMRGRCGTFGGRIHLLGTRIRVALEQLRADLAGRGLSCVVSARWLGEFA